MPGPYIHMSAMRNALQQMSDGFRPRGGAGDAVDPSWAGMDVAALSQMVADHPNFAALGAIGPDLFFFLPDFRDYKGVSISSVLVQVLKFLDGLYASMDPYITKYEKYIGPLGEDTSELVSRLTGGLSETVGAITSELSSILFTALEDFVVKQHDWFGYFSLGLNQGFDEQSFLWSDMLHYRSTGHFGRALWKNADATNDDTLRAYAAGYVTHLATDVTGHAFVNSIAGGPYRQHWQRHHLVENHCDAYWYQGDRATGAPRTRGGYDQYTESALYFDIGFSDDGSALSRPSYPGGNTLRDHWTRRRLLDVDSTLPDAVADLLTKSLGEIYYTPGVVHPKILANDDGRPSHDQVKESYDLLFRFLKFTTVDGFAHELPPPPPVFGNLNFPTRTDPAQDGSPADGGGGGGGGHHHSFWDDLLDFVLAVANAIGYALEVVAWLLTLPIAIINDVVFYPIRYLLYYALEKPLHDILSDFRAVLVLTGYMSPMNDEIATSLVQIGTTASKTFDQIKAEMGDVFGGLADVRTNPEFRQRFADPMYPHLNSNSKDDGDLEYHHPWSYPQTLSENALTVAGPYAQGAEPSVLFRGIETNQDLVGRYEACTDPAATDAVSADLTPLSHLGDPVAFSKYLVWLATRQNSLYDDETITVTDWNLDADRGYGYKCWDWNRHSEPGVTTNDPEGNPFHDPCVWPTQADAGVVPPAPMLLHYVPGEDPGCPVPPAPPVPPR